MSRKAKQNVEPHVIREISVLAITCPMTVTRYFDGLPVRNLSRRRIEKAIAELQLRDVEMPAVPARVREGRSR